MLCQLWCILFIIRHVSGRGLLLLYRPKDITNECVFSHKLRYDISYGMGMSDTTTLVLRNLHEIDYECEIEIVTDDEKDIFLLVVIHFPNAIDTNCAHNKNAFTVLKKNRCLAICDYLADKDTNSPYYIVSFRRKIRFRFISNSSINNDMDAHVYQVTATAGRKSPRDGCNWKNETVCGISKNAYCITSGVVCDGIKNCGVTDWYDERKSECETPLERIGYAPVVAVLAVILCVLLAASHCILRYLPKSANTFFIFNANEDNRLCIDPVLKPPDSAPDDVENVKRTSLIPVSSSSSDESDQPVPTQAVRVEGNEVTFQKTAESQSSEPKNLMEVSPGDRIHRKTTMRTMAEMFNHGLRAVTNRARHRNAEGAIEEIFKKPLY